jgi:hypothetical protein
MEFLQRQALKLATSSAEFLGHILCKCTYSKSQIIFLTIWAFYYVLKDDKFYIDFKYYKLVIKSSVPMIFVIKKFLLGRFPPFPIFENVTYIKDLPFCEAGIESFL